MQLLTYELTPNQWFLLAFSIMLVGPFVWISETVLFVLQSSHLEDSESAALFCCECEESEIFSDSNVRRYMILYSLWWLSKSFLAFKSNWDSAYYFIYLTSLNKISGKANKWLRMNVYTIVWYICMHKNLPSKHIYKKVEKCSILEAWVSLPQKRIWLFLPGIGMGILFLLLASSIFFPVTTA